MKTQTVIDNRFTAINDIAENSAYYIALSALDRATVARILLDAGYCSLHAAHINPEYPKRQQWDLCREAGADVIHYCKAVKGLLDSEGYHFSYNGKGWVSSYKYSVTLDGTLKDNDQGLETPYPHGALKCLVEVANLFKHAFKDIYPANRYVSATDIIERLVLFTNGADKDIQNTVGRAKAVKTMALYRENIRHRNTVYAIKNNL